jgi:hypothetical protein
MASFFRFPVPSQPAFLVAAVLLLVGAVASLVTPARVETVVSATVAFATAGTLILGHILLLLDFNHQRHIPLANMLPPDYGFWLAAGVLLALGVVNEVVARRSPPAESPTATEPPAVPAAG